MTKKLNFRFTYESSFGDDFRSTGPSRHVDHSLAAVEHNRRTHGRHRHLAWFDVVARRRDDTEPVDRSRSGRVVHLVVEDDARSSSTNFAAETVHRLNSMH